MARIDTRTDLVSTNGLADSLETGQPAANHMTEIRLIFHAQFIQFLNNAKK